MLVSVGFWPLLQTDPLAFPVPLPPPATLHPLHQPAPSAGKLSKGLFSRMGSENSALFVLAAVTFPVEGVECPGAWGGPQDATWRGGGVPV